MTARTHARTRTTARRAPCVCVCVGGCCPKASGTSGLSRVHWSLTLRVRAAVCGPVQGLLLARRHGALRHFKDLDDEGGVCPALCVGQLACEGSAPP